MKLRDLLDIRVFPPKSPPPVYPCGTCGSRLFESVAKHRIGSAFVGGKQLAKWCDGTET